MTVSNKRRTFFENHGLVDPVSSMNIHAHKRTQVRVRVKVHVNGNYFSRQGWTQVELILTRSGCPAYRLPKEFILHLQRTSLEPQLRIPTGTCSPTWSLGGYQSLRCYRVVNGQVLLRYCAQGSHLWC